MTPCDSGDAMCRCGHPAGQHTGQGECAIDSVRARREGRWQRGEECGCTQFVWVTR